ncbi:hypothetical protein [Bradyrhizobium sp. LHD-71]|uniref:hypothetical protein n=1 Tax=Bradyrhizobium sp. LHD-71 TaxID=3072141 RepID=UPI00280F8156|nr:hypothetical protein [Bradyrhizobium sp. LHD-71]MDQ8729828.1 hypothetical protein [Bradyrhizobium sp. LHD-71]
MLPTEYLKSFRDAVTRYQLASPRSGPQGAYDSAFDFEAMLKTAFEARHQTLASRPRRAIGRGTRPNLRDSDCRRKGYSEQLLPDNVLRLLKARLTEEEVESIIAELKRAGNDQNAQQPPRSSEPPQNSTAMDAAMRVRTGTTAPVYNNGVLNGVRYVHGIACGQVEVHECSSPDDFAARFPNAARIRNL